MKLTLKVTSTLLGLLGLALVGCTGGGEEPEAEGTLATYTCPGGETIEAIFMMEEGREVAVSLPDQDTLTLPSVEAASGAKYSDGTTTFWEQGGEAMVEVDGEIVLQGCVAE
ncbi:MAG: MliC family protein [Leptolyngbyaceae cyanobacterium]